jgi:hypothetical protein
MMTKLKTFLMFILLFSANIRLQSPDVDFTNYPDEYLLSTAFIDAARTADQVTYKGFYFVTSGTSTITDTRNGMLIQPTTADVRYRNLMI